MTPRKAAPPAEQLAKLAMRRAELTEQLELLEARPRPFDQAAADIASAVARAGAAVKVPVYYAAQRDAGGVAAMIGYLRSIGSRPDTPNALTAFELLAAVAPELMTGLLVGRLKADYATRPTPLPDVEFAAERQRLSASIAAVENEAAELWWQLVDQGSMLSPPEIGAAALLGISQ